jgi:hypothetical protein
MGNEFYVLLKKLVLLKIKIGASVEGGFGKSASFGGESS